MKKISLFLLVSLCFFMTSHKALSQKIFKATKEGNIDYVKKYIAKGWDLNLTQEIIYEDESVPNEDMGLMAFASYNGHIDILKLLIASKAKIKNFQLMTNQALIKGTVGGSLPICKLLLENGATLTTICKSCHGRTPLQVAIGHQHWDIVDYYLEKGAELKGKDKLGFSLLHLTVASDNIAFAKKLIDTGIDVNEIDKDGVTPLMIAAANGKSKMFHFLLEKGADLSHEDENENNIFVWACQSNNQKLLTFLLEKGYDINTKDEEGFTGLAFSIWDGDIELAKFFIEKKADLTVLVEGLTYLELAKEHIKDKNFLHYLEKKMNE